MTLTQLEIFSKLAELKNFTLTAQQLNISQSAISHALKSLEKKWETQLFYRNNNEVELTVAGQGLLPYVNEMLNVSTIIHQQVMDLKGFKTGSLRIGSFGASSSNVLLPLILENFSREYPEIDVLIYEGTDKEVLQWIDERKVDLGFVVLPETRFDTFAVLEDIFVALIPKHLPIAQQSVVKLEELMDYPFILTSAGSQNHVLELFREAQLTPQVKYHLSQILSILNMVNSNAAVSIVADLSLDQNILQLYPNIVKRPLSPNIKRSIGLAVKNKQQMTPIAKAFIEIATQL
ncbi:LysR family transcriptional regulator [Acinetobacter vivianii]|uniref:LysR family transcriptional regulator n=1 Tax=Acinetobacter vivianii TaxID=1776742 RepID=UPI002DBFFF33|nr:LysR family transcriptional regulator [Acinetobacter vivianii]MEB6478941.1 LysR family transcriptional regulator [Acinetobacter vivianii]MEB6657227.1 LysR family transcriptional regulator [Acinetobacter vivianii]